MISDGAVGTLTKISSKLRGKTRERASALDGVDYKHYTPWLSIRPALDLPIPDGWLLQAPYWFGELITDKVYLGKVAEFMAGPGEIITRDIPGGPAAWPILVDAGDALPDIQKAFNDARSLIDQSQFLKSVYPALVDMVLPLARQKSSGFGTHFCRGAIFRAFLPGQSSLSVALDIVHEMGHQALMLLQSADAVISSDHEMAVFSEIRRTDRPAIQSLHATVALAYMLKLSQDLGYEGSEIQNLDDRQRGYGGTLRESLQKAIRSLRKSCTFTPVGEQVMTECEALAQA